MIITPPILASHVWTAAPTPANSEFNKTPINANIAENPKTNAKEFIKVFALVFSALTLVPDRYAIKPGTIGRMQGLAKDNIPAMKANASVGSAIIITLIKFLFPGYPEHNRKGDCLKKTEYEYVALYCRHIVAHHRDVIIQ